MLSPHEFATLILIKDAPDQVELGRAELGALLERQLISYENLASGRPRPYVTKDGNSLLKAIALIRQTTAVSSPAVDEVATFAFSVARTGAARGHGE